MRLIPWLFALMIWGWAAAFAAPSFPPLTGRVVDAAEILPVNAEQALTVKIIAMEAKTGHQMVVVTLADLQGYDIADYGYQLGRHWGIGDAAADDGVLFIIAPNDRKTRIEVGYGLEGVLTDALSSVILQSAVLPRFREGDMAGGVAAGAEAIIAQLTLDPATARARAEAAEAPTQSELEAIIPVIILIIWFTLFVLSARGRRRWRRAGHAGPIVIWGPGGGSGSGWGGGSGGGGFSGGGGSFGGGGSSGSW